jgi:hypothetical protein
MCKPNSAILAQPNWLRKITSTVEHIDGLSTFFSSIPPVYLLFGRVMDVADLSGKFWKYLLARETKYSWSIPAPANTQFSPKIKAIPKVIQ